MDPSGTLRLVAESKDYVRGGTQKDTYSPDEVMEVHCPLCASGDRERLYTEHGAIGIGKIYDKLPFQIHAFTSKPTLGDISQITRPDKATERHFPRWKCLPTAAARI